MKGGDCGLFSSCMKRRASCSAQIVEPTFTPTMRDAHVVRRQGRQPAESCWEPLPDFRFPDSHHRISAACSELSEHSELYRHTRHALVVYARYWKADVGGN